MVFSRFIKVFYTRKGRLKYCFYNYCARYLHSGCLLERTVVQEVWMQYTVYLPSRPSSHDIWPCPGNTAAPLQYGKFFLDPLVTALTRFPCICNTEHNCSARYFCSFLSLITGRRIIWLVLNYFVDFISKQ